MPSSFLSSSTNGHPADTQPNGNVLQVEREDTASRIREMLGVFWSGKWILLVTFILVVGATALYTYTLPERYQTSSLLLVNLDQDPVMEQLGGRSSSFGMSERSLANQLMVLRQSRAIAERVAERLVDMKRHPQTGARLSLVYDAQNNLLSSGQVASRVRGHVRATTVGNDIDAISVSAVSTVPSEAALLANLYSEAYIQRTREKSRESMQAQREFLENQSEKLQKEVRDVEATIESFMRQENAVSLNQESNSIIDRIAQIEAQRNELQIELDMKQASLQAAQAELDSLRPQLASRFSSDVGADLNNVRSEKAELEQRIDLIKQRNPGVTAGSDGPLSRRLADMQRRVRTLERRADSLATQYVDETLSANGVSYSAGAEEGGRTLAQIAGQQREIAQRRIEIDGLRAKLQSTESRLAEARQKLESIPSQSMRLAQLQRERRSTERIYGFVREKLQEVRIAEESESGYAEIIRPASIPGVPISPNRSRNLKLAAILGLLLGGGIVVLRNQLDTRLRDPDDLRKKGYHVLGVVPSMDEMIDANFDGQSRITLDDHTVDTTLTMLVSPMSSSAEAFRRLRTNLEYLRPDSPIRSLVVSSSDKGEGKTTTSANLALALASAGKNTLLVDADLRRPRIHEFLDLSRSPGLSDLLFDRTSLDADRFDTGIDNFSILPAGEPVPNPAEVIGSERMRKLIEDLRNLYDFVIFDTPPLLLFSDPLSLSTECDGTILVASADRTDIRAYNHAAGMLDDVDAPFLGSVLNRFDPESTSYGYGYGYAYSYRLTDDYYDTDDASPPGNGEGVFSRWFKT